ncbi:uncharacterized protein LOC17900545 isoform X2 [Capsella rubella]|uniref:uncharacterized protein LOC17900545 isoform X2 n=1 Tax=Capsella rubella TaxID=81985 RepID=UPI000CD51002|nr:uncharacterized protein LOC17900545 isoform X2 [Capsella rubella]
MAAGGPLFSAFLEAPFSFSSGEISREEFNSFHKIDRNLFKRFVFQLSRDVDQSFLAMGFLMLLEQCGYAPKLIASLLTIPDNLLNALANEVSVCITLLYNQEFASTVMAATDGDLTIIPLLYRITDMKLTLSLINQSGETFRDSLAKNWNGVCTRALEDICENARICNKDKHRLSVLQQENPNRFIAQQGTFSFPSPVRAAGERRMTEEERAAAAAVDDRTVFLTFSKGYPISEDEMVTGKFKNKYTINGKHVWARKYIRKNSSSPSASSPSASLPSAFNV